MPVASQLVFFRLKANLNLESTFRAEPFNEPAIRISRERRQLQDDVFIDLGGIVKSDMPQSPQHSFIRVIAQLVVRALTLAKALAVPARAMEHGPCQRGVLPARTRENIKLRQQRT